MLSALLLRTPWTPHPDPHPDTKQDSTDQEKRQATHKSANSRRVNAG